jgi:hypothetical protein
LEQGGDWGGHQTVIAMNQTKEMPQLAMPVRVLVMGTPQTPSLEERHPGLDEPKRCRLLRFESLKNIDDLKSLFSRYNLKLDRC